MGLLDWLRQLFPRRVRVRPDGKGYRVDDQWVATQVEVRQRLEEMGLSEKEILAILRQLSIEKYGHAGR